MKDRSTAAFFLDLRSWKVPGLALLRSLACVASGATDEVVPAGRSSVNPARKLMGSNTDRDLIDVEVVATSGAGPDARFIEPRRALRLRLERAYVGSVDWRQ